MRHFRLPLLFALLFALPLAVSADCMGPYPPSMVKAFTQNCATDPKLVSFCSCLLDEVQKNIPLADFIEIGNTGSLDNDPRFIKANKKCTGLMTGTPPASPAAPGSAGAAKSH